MAPVLDDPHKAPTPLEAFVRDYVETTGGVWDEVEPQVYDVLLPAEDPREPVDVGGREILRIAFDPEALPEHPGAQLASFGTPLIDRLLAEAMHRGRSAQLYLVGLNLAPHDLAGRVRRALTLPAEAKLHLERVRPLHFAQAIFWFEATFVSDQKEQEIVPVAMDLHYGRQVRHLMYRARKPLSCHPFRFNPGAAVAPAAAASGLVDATVAVSRGSLSTAPWRSKSLGSV
jgi:hypothetical protein